MPTLWFGLFFAVPILILLKISLAESVVAQPPFTDLWSGEGEGLVTLTLNFGNYLWLAQDDLYLAAYVESIRIAALGTLVCLLLGYPMALGIAAARSPWQQMLLALVVLPFWTSFLLRVYAWIGFLGQEGLINQLLLKLGIISAPLVMLQTDGAVLVGIVYTYLPFMILPIYANLSRIEPVLKEASADLGAPPWATFRRVTLPLSLPGVFAGVMLVFIPAIGEFVIPALLGGADTLMIGRVLWDEFFANRDWPVASAVALAILVLVVVPVTILRSVSAPSEERS